MTSRAIRSRRASSISRSASSAGWAGAAAPRLPPGPRRNARRAPTSSILDSGRDAFKDNEKMLAEAQRAPEEVGTIAAPERRVHALEHRPVRPRRRASPARPVRPEERFPGRPGRDLELVPPREGEAAQDGLHR